MMMDCVASYSQRSESNKKKKKGMAVFDEEEEEDEEQEEDEEEEYINDAISDSDFDYSSELEDLWEKSLSRQSSSGDVVVKTIVPVPTRGRIHPSLDQVVPMIIDTDEELWTRVNDIYIEGTVFHYCGEGKSIKHNGFAQTNVALNPAQNYFEITILDPGENCYIAIGLARRDYPLQKHPGWNRGSVAFHADDGKLFVGGGVGTPFGPTASRNDVLGCGIVFPPTFPDASKSCSERIWPWEKDPEDLAPPKARFRRRRYYPPYQNVELNDHSSDSEDEIWWMNRNQVYFDEKVFVFFRRNGVLLGIKEVRIPKGGFYPTIGMLSKHERVEVNLHPLSLRRS